MYTPQLIHSDRTARANAIYQHALANRPSENLLDPTHRLFAKSGYGRISHPDSVFAQPKSEQDVQSRRLVSPRKMSRTVRPGPNREHYLPTAESSISHQDTSGTKPDVFAMGTGSPRPENKLSNRIASLTNRAPLGPKAKVGKQKYRAAERREPVDLAGRARLEADHGVDFESYETAAVGPLFNWLLRATLTGGKLATKTGPKNVKPPRLKRTAKDVKRPQNAKEKNNDPGRSTPTRSGRSEIWKQRAAEAAKQDLEGDRSPLDVRGVQRIEDVYLEIQDYLRKHPYVPETYWLGHGRKPTQMMPGVRMTHDDRKASTTDKPYPRTTHFDEFGREIGQTHRTHHGQPDPNKRGYHPNPHYHRRNVLEEGAPYVSKDGTKGGRIWPGLFGYPWR